MCSQNSKPPINQSKVQMEDALRITGQIFLTGRWIAIYFFLNEKWCVFFLYICKVSHYKMNCYRLFQFPFGKWTVAGLFKLLIWYRLFWLSIGKCMVTGPFGFSLENGIVTGCKRSKQHPYLPYAAAIYKANFL